MYKTEHYDIKELAHPQIINKLGAVNAWHRLDAGALRDLDFIRAAWFNIYGSGIYCNRLEHGLDSRGLRPPDDPDGAFYSIHKEGAAFDLEPVNGLIRSLYEFIFELIRSGVLEAFNTLEDFECTLGWVHVAKMNTSETPLVIQP